MIFVVANFKTQFSLKIYLTGSNTNPDVDKLLVQILEESNNMSNVASTANVTPPTSQPQQRITTIQLTPQKQQHLKNIQLQIQSLSARLTSGDTEMQNMLKNLFTEQQKILASGKLLPPDKVSLKYHLHLIVCTFFCDSQLRETFNFMYCKSYDKNG